MYGGTLCAVYSLSAWIAKTNMAIAFVLRAPTLLDLEPFRAPVGGLYSDPYENSCHFEGLCTGSLNNTCIHTSPLDPSFVSKINSSWLLSQASSIHIREE